MDRISLGTWFGVPLFVHPFALFVLAFYALSDAQTGGAMAILNGGILGVGVFASILVHELGHALAAKAFGMRVLEMELHGFGGSTRYMTSPRPWPGIFITFAGPLAGLVLGCIFLVLPPVIPPVAWLASFNLFWSVVNLLPLFPLDGGQILRHFLSLFIGEVGGITWSARVAIPGWVAIGIWCVVSMQLFLLFIVFQSLQSVVPLAMGAAGGRRPPRR